MTPPAGSSLPTKVLSIDLTFSSFFYFFPSITDNCNCGSLFRKDVKMEVFSLFTRIYSKININVVNAILPQQ